MGFQLRQDNHFYGTFIDYIIQGNEADFFRRFQFGLWGNLYQRRLDNEIDTFWLHPYAQILFKNGMSILASTWTYEENLLNSFTIQDKTIDAGHYIYSDTHFYFDSPDGWYFKPNMTLRFGEYYNGKRQIYDIGINWVVNNHLNISPSIRSEKLDFHGEDRLVFNNIRTSMNVSLNKNLSGRILIQYLDYNHKISLNSRIRYNFYEGHDLWLVYNEIYDKDLIDNSYTDYRSNNRSIILKYTNTFIF